MVVTEVTEVDVVTGRVVVKTTETIVDTVVTPGRVLVVVVSTVLTTVVDVDTVDETVVLKESV